MWEKIRTIFTIPELRQKIFLTVGLLGIYRLGFGIPLFLVDPNKTSSMFGGGEGNLGQMLEQVAIFSASSLSQATIFGLGIMPYISASIIFQLLGSVWPKIAELQKEGEAGRKKINEYTRYATVLICVIQSWFYVKMMASGQSATVMDRFLDPNTGAILFGWHVLGVVAMTAGTVFLMWVGEQIDEYGIGNGISLLIMAGILADMPGAATTLIGPMIKQGGLELGGDAGVEKLIVLAALFVAVVAGTVFIMQGQRRIPTQSAKHVRGRRVFGGTRQYLPLRVNQAGVMPIIFASSLLMFPSIMLGYLASYRPDWTFLQYISSMISDPRSFVHTVLYIALIYFFCFFWTAISFNPKDVADNLKNFGSFIPGYRPGKRTADYLEKVMARITYVGAGFLAVIAIIPTLVSSLVDIDPTVARFYGGTGLLIAVSVAFDLVNKIDSHLVMRNYRGLLEKG
ncbi:MAG: preprotein translocase subunit SecY [Pirellulales bacterium]|nr:preprotein translocase subunit SecY [Planctomycetales bacterium]